MQIPHIPVLLDEVVEYLGKSDGWIVDATLGYGGHSEALLQANEKIKIFGIDQDKEAIEFSKKRLALFHERIEIVKGRYSQKIQEALEKYPIKAVLADIGVSSLQLDKKERGFSFDSELLDMRMDRENPLSAKEVVNDYSLQELIEIFQKYAELRGARRVAEAIVKNRPFSSAKDLKELIEKVVPKTKKIHPATTIFQAIRIEVNKELLELEKLLDTLEEVAPSGAKVAIITFHSLEDRIVKNRFRKWAKRCICSPEALRCECGANHHLGKILTKKPITASDQELKSNPRSRSAKLRIFEFKGEDEA